MRAQLGFLSEAEVHERFFLCFHLSPHRAPSGTAVGRQGPIRCQRQHRRLNLLSSITVVPTLESPSTLKPLICVFLSKEGELRTECRDVQFRYFLIELLRKEVEFVFVGCGIIPIRQQIKLQQHWFVEDHDIRKE